MSPLILIVIGVIFLGIGFYQLIQSKPQLESVPQPSLPVSELQVVSNAISKDYHQALEEAIEVAVADGTLTKREEKLLRDKAKLAGKDPDELILQLREDLVGTDNSETEIIDASQRAGLNFEKYVVQKFNPKYFKINQWAGDKFVAGRYAETTLEPDIQLTLSAEGDKFPLAVECKWRRETEDDFIRFAEDYQLLRYQEFEKRTGKPTFIVLGVDGKPGSPHEVFIIPVGVFKNPNQHKSNLVKFKKWSQKEDFYFDREKGELR